MKLRSVNRNEFSLWSKYRKSLYSELDDDYDQEEMKNIFDSDSWLCQFVEDNDGKLIGLVELSFRNIADGCLSTPVPYLEGFYLVENKRNKGLGKKIIQLLVDWCKEHGYTELATDTELKNERAQRFYEKLGFKEIDRIVEYKIEISKT
jgi:aminoglycoside 6'-N-acetyltransferase I